MKYLSKLMPWFAMAVLAVALPMSARADDNVFDCNLDALASSGLVLDPAKEVTISLTPGEREVLNLAIPGYIADLQKEQEGADAGGFAPRSFGLFVFSGTTVPCIRHKINDDATGPEDTVTVTFNSFERVAVQIMMSIWNPRDGVMAHHLRGCRRSRQLANDFLCPTFTPLARGALSLFKKVSRDSRERRPERD